MKLKNIFPFLGIALVALAMVLWAVPSLPPSETVSSNENPQSISVTLVIGNTPEISIDAVEYQTVLEVLEELNKTDTALKLKTKTYEGLGTLVESMYDFHNGENNSYWQYRVDTVSPLIGADKYELHGGEYIEWYFDPSTF